MQTKNTGARRVFGPVQVFDQRSVSSRQDPLAKSDVAFYRLVRQMPVPEAINT